jgi:conjugal transfer ATP-binding protein TraC
MMESIITDKMQWKIERNDLAHMATLLLHVPLSQTSGAFHDLNQLGLSRKMWSMNAANVVPIIAEMKGMSSKKSFFVGRRGQVFYFDPFSHKRGNYNMAIVAGSGMGKSFLIQDNIYSQLSTGARVWVVDVGRSYYKLAHMFGGEFVVFEKGTQLQINPFWTKARGTMDKDTTDSFLKFVASFIFSMAYPDGEFADGRGWQKSKISSVVRRIWMENVKSKTTRFPTVQDVIEELAKMDDARGVDLSVLLEPFGRDGSYGAYFNGDGGLDFDNNFMVFELEEITDDSHLRSLVFMLLIHHITEKMYLSDRSQRMILIVDEAWDLLKGGAGGDIIESVARRARKYNGSLWTATQSIFDYSQSIAARAAWDNSYWQCLLSQDGAAIETATREKLITLKPMEERLLKNLRTVQGVYSEVMIRGKSGEYMVGRFLVDPFSKALFSTQAGEFRELNQLCSSGLSMEDAVTEIAVSHYGLEV